MQSKGQGRLEFEGVSGCKLVASLPMTRPHGERCIVRLVSCRLVLLLAQSKSMDAGMMSMAMRIDSEAQFDYHGRVEPLTNLSLSSGDRAFQQGAADRFSGRAYLCSKCPSCSVCGHRIRRHRSARIDESLGRRHFVDGGIAMYLKTSHL